MAGDGTKVHNDFCPMHNEFDVRIQKLEKTLAVLEANVDLIDPGNLIKFQAETVAALKALNKAMQENKNAANRRTTISISILGIVLIVVQILVAIWPKG